MADAPAFRPTTPRRPGAPTVYAVAAGVGVLAILLAYALRPVLHRDLLSLIPLAVALSASYGGLRAGLATTAVSVAGAAALLLAPGLSLRADDAADLATLGLLAGIGVFVSALLERVAHARGRAAASEDRFRRMVEGVADYAIFGLDAEGRVITWNRGAQRLKGYTEREIEGRHFSVFYTPEDVDRGHPQQELRVAAEQGRYEEEGWRVRKDGSRFWAWVVITAMHDDAGRLIGYSKVTRDLTERRRAEQEIRAREGRMAAVVASAMDAIITTDEQRRIVMFNHAAERLFGVGQDEVVGTLLDRFVPARFHGVHSEHMRAFGETGVTTRSMHRASGALPAVRADGTEFPVEATISQAVVAGQRLFTVVLRDVTERLRAERERERLIGELEAANRAKSDFLATMSHELRTPINAVVGYVDLMELGIGGPVSEQHGEYLRRIRASSQHLRGLIDDVLDMARIEAGAVEVRSESSPLPEAVQAALELVAPQAAAKSIRLDDGECYPVRYRGDPDRVRQVLVNVLGNAVKFTRPGGRVELRCLVSARPPEGARAARPGPFVGVEVSDTGIGIPAEEIERIFEPFTQVGEAYTREQGGTGLGLAISRRLARRMGGDLVAASRPGAGSVFTLWLPAEAADALELPQDGPPEAPRAAVAQDEAWGLGRIGRALADMAVDVVAAWAERLRADPGTPHARGLDAAQLEDHVTTMLVELGKQLVSLDQGGGEPGLLRDDADIQVMIAVRHGQQRARLDWTEDELRREYELLREEVAARVDRLAGPPEQVAAARGLLDRLLRRAEEVSLGEMARAR
ncbi:MAG TPA: PAS domain S-box protein [Longimicrobium sp.]|nr:PAS domain S-box protein [Longimicrobium sp.]